MKVALSGQAARLPASAGAVGGLVARFVRKSGTPLLVLYALALGAVLGLASADWATRGGYPFGGSASAPGRRGPAPGRPAPTPIPAP